MMFSDVMLDTPQACPSGRTTGSGICIMSSIEQEGVMSRSAPICAVLLLISGLAWAQDRPDAPSPVQPNFNFPAGVEITSQWNYSCRDSKPCAFSCGSADSVKALTLYLGTIPVGNNQRNLVIFYFYSTATQPYNSGFRISGGPASTLSCDVTGMTLDYSGLPRSSEAAKRP